MPAATRSLPMICTFGMILSPSAAFAEVCDKERPGWDGIPVTAWYEAVNLLFSPLGLLLLAGTLLSVRFRSQWGSVATVVGWTIFVSLITMFDPTGIRGFAIEEGCIGSPALFIVAVFMICGALILYTAPNVRAKDNGDT